MNWHEGNWAEAFQRSTQLSRRGFAATGLVAGFTLCTGPLNAAAIITDGKGLDAGEVKVPASDGQMPAYRAKPQGKTKSPTVLVVQEIFGVHEHIRDICRRFAHLGYYAIAPSLYFRQGDPGKYDMNTVQQLMTDLAKLQELQASITAEQQALQAARAQREQQARTLAQQRAAQQKLKK